MNRRKELSITYLMSWGTGGGNDLANRFLKLELNACDAR